MDSDAPLLDLIEGELVEALQAAVPHDWRVLPAEGQTTQSLGIVLYYEQGALVTTLNGGPVPSGYLGVEFTLTLAAPEADPEKGTKRVTRAITSLLPALDAMSSVYWDRAEKVRLDTGETTYRLTIVSLSRYRTPTPNPEPDTEPDPMPEEA